MNYPSITRRAVGLAVAFAAVAGGSAQAATLMTPEACTQPSYSFSQPFQSVKDAHWYTLAPGQSVNSFTGEGWTLSGGAAFVTTTLADGSTGTVLDLPAGATAVSPPMCVNSAFPSARAVVRDLVGPPSLHVFVQYTNTKSWQKPINAGAFAGQAKWAVSQPLGLHPGDLHGWQEETFTLTGGDKGTDAQIYNLYVDPRCFW